MSVAQFVVQFVQFPFLSLTQNQQHTLTCFPKKVPSVHWSGRSSYSCRTEEQGQDTRRETDLESSRLRSPKSEEDQPRAAIPKQMEGAWMTGF